MANSLLLNANSLNIPLADKSVQMVCCSPPYWGLRSYNTGPHKHLELGSEPLHDCLGWATGTHCGECYVCHTLAWTREVRRVLRDDGVFFINLGDSYNGSGGAGGDYNAGGLKEGQPRYAGRRISALKPKDLCMIPARVALALQADGWFLRSEIIWHKPSAMPESVRDRCTRSHEIIWMFSKQQHYFFDNEAIKEPAKDSSLNRLEHGAIRYGGKKASGYGTRLISGNEWVPKSQKAERTMAAGAPNIDERKHADKNGKPYILANKRDVWTVANSGFSGAHFATWPPALVEPMIKAGTSEAGCCSTCGAPYERVMKQVGEAQRRWSGNDTPTIADNLRRDNGRATQKVMPTTGFRPTCDHDAPAVPCIVLDPFNGSGTTGLVCQQLGRRYIGLDLSPAYLQLSRERLGMVALEEWQSGKAADASDLTGLPLFAQD